MYIQVLKRDCPNIDLMELYSYLYQHEVITINILLFSGSFHNHELYFLSQSSALNFIPVNQIKEVFEAQTKHEKYPLHFQVHDESGRSNCCYDNYKFI